MLAYSGGNENMMRWIATLIICVHAIFNAGVTIQTLVHVGFRDAASLHQLARDGVLALAALSQVVIHSPASLCTLTLVLGAIQLGNFAISIYLRDTGMTASSLLFSLLTLACAIPLVAQLALPKRPGREH